MKILIFSDSHGTMQYMCEAIEKEHPDYVIHLGDHAQDAKELSIYYRDLPITWVKGNCDHFYDAPLTKLVTYDGKKVFLCHGHTYGVKGGLLRVVYAAKEAGADILLFGHTHIPFHDQSQELILLNPGACGDKNYFGKPTYGIMELGQGKPIVKYDFI